MATIKAFSDLDQSHKLAEILPLESADIWWSRCIITDFDDGVLKVSYAVEPCNISQFRNTDKDIPCWSLTALFSVLPKIHGTKPILDLEENSIQYSGIDLYVVADNSVDACYKMILKLNELNLL